MPFWTYMLHCADRTFYVGHTDDLEVRLAQHEQGTLGGYTATRKPVKLVWCGEFPSRYEALSAERQIKGWSRAKKMALIRDDWDAIGRARNREDKGKASTGSARTEEGMPGFPETVRPPQAVRPPQTVRPELVEGPVFLLKGPMRHALKRHPHSESEIAIRIDVEVSRSGPGVLALRYCVAGAIDAIRLPPAAAPVRADGLWEHTCFEAFVRAAPGAYHEFNLAPSTQWAAYRFAGYREGREDAVIPPPRIETRADGDCFELQAMLEMPDRLADAPWHLGLSAVIEDKSGRKSWWALAHPPGDPDFHHEDCFALTLPPAA